MHNDNNRVSIYCLKRCGCKLKKGKKKGCKCETHLCSFKVHCRRLKSEETFQIKSLNLHHNCEMGPDNTKITSDYLAERYLEHWRADPNWKLSAFQSLIERELGIKVGYYKCYYARAKAKECIYGLCEDQYKRVWDYATAIKKHNPGSSAYVQVDRIDRPPPVFQRLYVCLNACKEGFKAGCRPIIGVDGCHLKGAYPGQCLVAVGIDGNNNIYPIAWSVVEVENIDSWSWFLDLLMRDLGEATGDGWTFMSDRQKGLLEAFASVVPNAQIRFCVRHIWANFKISFPGSAYKNCFWSAARATTKEEFHKQMESIKFFSKDAHRYLDGIDPKHWSRHAFSTGPKSDLLLNNICESFNNVLREVRDKPILTHMEWMRRYVMKRHFAKREGVMKFEGRLMPNVQKTLEWSEKESRNCLVAQAGVDEYEVDHKDDRHVVNLANRTCGCFKWDLTGIPCCHAFKCIEYNRKKIVDYVHEAYSKETFLKAYSVPIHPLPGMKQWEKTGHPEPEPPLVRKMPGRPSKRRRRLEPGELEEMRLVKRSHKPNQCKRCGQLGHNKRTCKNDPTPPPNPEDPNMKGGQGRPKSEYPTTKGIKKRRYVKKQRVPTQTSQQEVDHVYEEFMPPSTQESTQQSATPGLATTETAAATKTPALESQATAATNSSTTTATTAAAPTAKRTRASMKAASATPFRPPSK